MTSDDEQSVDHPALHDGTCSRCHHDRAKPPHTCPFKTDAYEEYDLCECCDSCEIECALEI